MKKPRAEAELIATLWGIPNSDTGTASRSTVYSTARGAPLMTARPLDGARTGRTVAYCRRMDDVAVALRITASLGLVASRGHPLPGGKENYVVRVRTASDDVVVRFARDEDRKGVPFDVEAWCLEAAARAGIRTSEMVAHGVLDGRAYLVATHVPGVPAASDDLSGWRAIGEFVSSLHRLQTYDAPDGLFSRFGRDLDHAWQEHLAYNLGALGPDDTLVPVGVYRPDQRRALSNALESLRERQLPQGIVHGDTAHRNLLRDGSSYCVIDWGAASTGPVMWGDLERIFRWHRQHDAQSPVSDAARAQVLAGAGLILTEAAPIISELAILRVLDLARWAMDRQPNRLEGIVAEAQELLPTVATP